MNRRVFLNVIVNFALVLIVVGVSYFALSDSYTTAAASKNDVYYKGRSDLKRVSLMFNVYQDNESVIAILKTLDKYDCKATFFVGGCWAEKNPELLQAIFLSGHEIGNHGYFHKQHDKLSRQDNVDEISATHKLVKSILNVDMQLFAPPSGAFDSLTLAVAEQLGYNTIMWSKDTIDWRDRDSELIKSRACTNATNGDLILMHPTEATAKALSDIIEHFANSGFEIVTVSQNIYN